MNEQEFIVNYIEVGKRLRTQRKKKMLTQGQLADLA